MTDALRNAVSSATPLLTTFLRGHYAAPDDAAANLAAIKRAAESLTLDDWEQAIHFHGIAHLLTQRHGEEIKAVLPAGFHDRAAALSGRQLGHGLTQAGALKPVLAQLAAHDIAAVPLKGQALSLRLYGAVGHRAPGDIDLLVDPDHVTQAAELLGDLGWHSVSPPGQTVSRQFMTRNHHQRFQNKQNMVLELHWRSAASTTQSLPRVRLLQPDLILRNSGGLTYLDLPDQMLARLVLTHSARSMCGRLKWAIDTLDMMEIVQLDDMDHVTARAAMAAHTIAATALGLPTRHKIGRITKWLNMRAHQDEMLRLSHPQSTGGFLINAKRVVIRVLATLSQHPASTRIAYVAQMAASRLHKH